nr:MAG TPA: hypothetical protein [Caudoviricetes sp.]
MSNYAVINGKRVELTDEQVKALGIERTNPFKRAEPGDVYYKISEYGEIDDLTEAGDYTDNNLYEGLNYFNDDSVALQVALHQLLYRKLLKFAYDNGLEDDKPWDCDNKHYHVYYSHAYKTFTAELNYEGKHAGVYFPSPEAAKRAIKEVIEPFVKEHPGFVW